MYGSSSENRGTSLRLGFLSAWTRLKLVVLASQCGTVAFAGIFDKPQGGFGFSRFATNQSHTEGWLAWQNLSNGHDLPPTSNIEMSSRFLVESSMLQFAEDEESVQSEEEVVTCEMHLIADFPLGLIGEAGILILEATRVTLQLRKNYVVLTGSISSPNVDGDLSIPDGIVMQAFRFDLAVLPPKGGSADISFMLRKAAESAILIKFQDLVRSSEAMKEARGAMNLYSKSCLMHLTQIITCLHCSLKGMAKNVNVTNAALAPSKLFHIDDTHTHMDFIGIHCLVWFV